MNISKISQHFFRFLHPAKCSQSNSKTAKDIKDNQSRLNYFCRVVYEALIWLQKNNPIYMDIQIDSDRLNGLPEDDIPEDLLLIICREDDDKIVEKKRESYVCDNWERNGEGPADEGDDEHDGQKLNDAVDGKSPNAQ